jgi:hypothetical protein
MVKKIRIKILLKILPLMIFYFFHRRFYGFLF